MMTALFILALIAVGIISIKYVALQIDHFSLKNELKVAKEDADRDYYDYLALLYSVNKSGNLLEVLDAVERLYAEREIDRCTYDDLKEQLEFRIKRNNDKVV